MSNELYEREKRQKQLGDKVDFLLFLPIWLTLLTTSYFWYVYVTIPRHTCDQMQCDATIKAPIQMVFLFCFFCQISCPSEDQTNLSNSLLDVEHVMVILTICLIFPLLQTCFHQYVHVSADMISDNWSELFKEGLAFSAISF